MTNNLLRRIVLPVASVKDAETTCEQVFPRLSDGGGNVLTVHVIEKAGGAPDKASVEQLEGRAAEIFAAVESALAEEGIDVETEIRYGTDVAEAVLDAAVEFDASAIVFTPRGGSRWVKLLAGDTAAGLVENADRPVIALPDTEDEGQKTISGERTDDPSGGENG